MDTTNYRSATITVRLIKSFQYRSIKLLVLPNIDLTTTTTSKLKTIINDKIIEKKLLNYQNNNFDTLKIYSQPHKAKSSNLVINLTDEQGYELNVEKPLLMLNVQNETEISFFNKCDYEKYKLDPQIKW